VPPNDPVTITVSRAEIAQLTMTSDDGRTVPGAKSCRPGGRGDLNAANYGARRGCGL